MTRSSLRSSRTTTQHVDEKGTSIPSATHLARFHALRGVIFAGTPMAKLGSTRALFERNGESMTHSSHMAAAYIPKVEACEFSAMLDEIRG